MTTGGTLRVTSANEYKNFEVKFSRNTEITNFAKREMGQEGDIRAEVKNGNNGFAERIYSNGSIIIFTILRNISAKTWSLTANAGKAHPTRTPNNSAAKIAIVNRDCFKIFSFSKPFNCKLYNKQEKSIQTCYDLLRILPAMIDTHICSS